MTKAEPLTRRARRATPTPNADPYNETAYPDQDPPIPGNPCRFDASKVVAGSAGGAFTNYTGGAPSEDQLVAFVHHNGPTQTGIDADVFGLRAKGCEATGDCWITADDCKKVANKPIDHSILLVGYGTDAEKGDYWLVKNSLDPADAAAAQPPLPPLTIHLRRPPPPPPPPPPIRSRVLPHSWSTAFANGGFIFVQRGVNCGNIACCGNTFTYGDPAAYYE
jgi:hypothetical protein